MKKFTVFIFAILLSVAGFAQGTETFDNLGLDPGSNSYADGSFTGQDGSTWNFLQCRGDFTITGTAIMLGRNRTPDAELTSGTLHNGIGTLQFSYMQAFSSGVNLEVYVNDVLYYTATTDGTQTGTVMTTDPITINVSGDFTLKFYNPNGGQVVIDDVIWTGMGNDPTLNISSPSDGQVYAPGETASIQFNISNFSLSSSASAGDGDGYIEYTVSNQGTGDETTTDYFTTDPITLSSLAPGDYTVTMALVDNDGNPVTAGGSAVEDAVSFTLGSVTSVSSIGELRNGTIGSYYTLTSEAVLTYQQSFRNQKYIQDNTGAILIDDDPGIITTTYNRYDGITGITGKLATNNGTMEFQPTEDPGAASSTGNDIDPVLLTVPDFMADPIAYESQVIAFQDISFTDADGTATFATGTDYTVTDNSANETIMRTNFYDADYIGAVIPQGTLDAVVGIAAHFQGAGQFFMRDTDDLNGVPLGVQDFDKSTIGIYPNPAISQFYVKVEGQAHVEIYSILGQRVANLKITNTTPISVANLNSGLYLVKIVQNGRTFTKKLMVK